MELIGDGTGPSVPNAGFSLTSPSQPNKTEPSSSGGELLDLLGELHQPMTFSIYSYRSFASVIGYA